MLTLFKYELRKNRLASLIMLAITFALQGVFMYGFFAGKMETATLASILLVGTGILGVICEGVQSVVTLHRDMNTKQSYMLFMTPHSSYSILGAKALQAVMTVVLAAVFFFGLGVLDVQMLFDKFGNIRQLKEMADEVMRSLSVNMSLDLLTVSLAVAQTVAGWIETIMLAFLSDVIVTALLKGKRFGGLLVFVLFVIMSSLTVRIMGLVPAMGSVTATAAVRTLAALAVAAVEYVASAVIMEKKLSV